MNKKQKVFFVILILVLLTLGIYAFIVNSNNKNEKDLSLREVAVEEESRRPEKTINLKHQYKDGVHFFAGTVETPTPCYEVTAEVLSGNPAELKIETKEIKNTNICAQVITELSYKTNFAGAEDINFIATVNGELVSLNQFEIPVDQDFDSVEIFIKG